MDRCKEEAQNGIRQEAYEGFGGRLGCGNEWERIKQYRMSGRQNVSLGGLERRVGGR